MGALRGYGRKVASVGLLSAVLTCSSCSTGSDSSGAASGTVQASQSQVSDTSVPTDSPSVTPTDTDAPSSTASSTASHGFRYPDIATGTSTLGGATVKTVFSVDTPTLAADDNSPPESVYGSCNWQTDTVTQATSVYVHGSVTISYQGALPDAVGLQIELDPAPQNLSEAGNVAIALPNDGGWAGCEPDTLWTVTMQPNQTVTAEFWGHLSDQLSNEHPTFTAATYQPYMIGFSALPQSEAGGQPTTTLTGSAVASCSDQSIYLDNSLTILPYSKLPATLPEPGTGAPTTAYCTKA